MPVSNTDGMHGYSPIDTSIEKASYGSACMVLFVTPCNCIQPFMHGA